VHLKKSVYRLVRKNTIALVKSWKVHISQIIQPPLSSRAHEPTVFDTAPRDSDYSHNDPHKSFS